MEQLYARYVRLVASVWIAWLVGSDVLLLCFGMFTNGTWGALASGGISVVLLAGVCALRKCRLRFNAVAFLTTTGAFVYAMMLPAWSAGFVVSGVGTVGSFICAVVSLLLFVESDANRTEDRL